LAIFQLILTEFHVYILTKSVLGLLVIYLLTYIWKQSWTQLCRKYDTEQFRIENWTITCVWLVYSHSWRL